MKGILLFAFNNDTTDYYKMAIATAKRANRFLDLPVTVVTDSNSITDNEYKFDSVIISNAQTSNSRNNNPWFNKGRYRAYDYTPYDETLILDTDYLINSKTLNTIFDLYDDFMCHKNTSLLMKPDSRQEMVSPTSFQTLWATVIAFRKTDRTKQIFECLKMVQENYMHYVRLYNIMGAMYRNDYGLTIATRIVNGQVDDPSMYIPWNLVHLMPDTRIYKVSDTCYNLINDAGKRPEYITIKDTDFHCMDKNIFMSLVDD